MNTYMSEHIYIGRSFLTVAVDFAIPVLSKNLIITAVKVNLL